MVTVEMGGAYGLPKYTHTVISELQQFLSCARKQIHISDISPRSEVRYTQRALGQINEEYPKVEG